MVPATGISPVKPFLHTEMFMLDKMILASQVYMILSVFGKDLHNFRTEIVNVGDVKCC